MAGSRKHWRDFTSAQRARLILGASIQLVLLVAALCDIRRRPPSQVKGGKRLWTALAFVNGIGPLSYFVFGRRRPDAGQAQG